MSMKCEDIERFADAYVDGELDLERTLALEAHVSACQACTARLDGMRAVRRARRTVADVAAATPSRQPRSVRARHRSWQAWVLSAASLVAASLVLAVVLHERTVTADDATTEAVIEGHVRSLMAGHLMDVASTDRH